MQQPIREGFEGIVRIFFVLLGLLALGIIYLSKQKLYLTTSAIELVYFKQNLSIVDDASVSLETHSAKIIFKDSSQKDVKAIVEAISGAGFEAQKDQ